MTFEKKSNPGVNIGTGRLLVSLKPTTLLFVLSLIFSAYAVPHVLLKRPHSSAAEKVTLAHGADQWDHNTNVTSPDANVPPGLQSATAIPVFQSYYQQHDGMHIFTTSTSNTSTTSSFDTLSPDLAHHLTTLGTN